jgi:hypothetical protein
MYTMKEINEKWPEHTRTSCLEDHPEYNADAEGHYCWRCNALKFRKDAKTIKKLKKKIRILTDEINNKAE